LRSIRVAPRASGCRISAPWALRNGRCGKSCSRQALADAAPGLDTGLFAAGVFSDAGLRAHELFSPDRRAAERRRRGRTLQSNSRIVASADFLLVYDLPFETGS
jgi:hypothetical protein